MIGECDLASGSKDKKNEVEKDGKLIGFRMSYEVGYSFWRKVVGFFWVVWGDVWKIV